MAEEKNAQSLVDSVAQMLKEESWTRTSISAYNVSNLVSLQSIVQKAADGGLEAEVKEVCDEHLKHTKDCVSALYISGMLSLEGDSLDNSKLVDLMSIFQRNRKNDEVKMLCRDILNRDAKNKFALRTLANCYKEEKSDEVWPLYERIVKLDSAEANAARSLGDHYEKENDVDNAVDYYKTALIRYIKGRNINGTKDVWQSLVELVPEDLDFFVRTKRDIAKYISKGTSASLLLSLYKHYKKVQNYDVCIDLLKQILEVDPADDGSRKALVECYRSKYEGVDKLEDYIRVSNLNQSYRNVFEAISDFEKHIAFKSGTFVWHKTWGVGKIISIKEDMLHINFGRKRGSTENEIHDLSLKTAVSILTPLSGGHFWVIRATTKHDELRAMFGISQGKQEKGRTRQAAREKMENMLKIIIKSFGNKCDMKRIRQEVVPSVLTADEWTSWHSQAKSILEESPSFGVDPNDAAVYTVLPQKAAVGNKIAEEFKAQKQFLDRIDTMMKYAMSLETNKGEDGEDFADMVQYFMGFMKPKTEAQSFAAPTVAQAVNAMEAWLALHGTYCEMIKAAQPKEDNKRKTTEASQALPEKAKANEAEEAQGEADKRKEDAKRAEALDKELSRDVPFKEIYSRITSVISSPKELYTSLKDTRSLSLHDVFVKAVKEYLDDWDKQYIALFPVATDGNIIKALEEAGKGDALSRLVRDCIDNWKDNRNAVICLLREYTQRPWFNAAEVSEDRRLIVLINIVDLTFREIENHVNTTENKKTNKAATTLLFKASGENKNGLLVSYILSNGEEAARRMFTLINDIKHLDPSYKALMRSRILENYSNFVFPVTEEKVKQQTNTMFVTAKKLEQKKAEAENIQSIEIPNNAAEISEARKQGDLKENAEYKAAREAQHFLNERLSQLTSEIAKAVVFDPATATSAVVSFSTEVTLHNSKTNKDEVRKIFGPWESDPDKGIISYLSPLGQALMDKKVGEAASSSKEHDFSFYTVKAIKTTEL